MDTGWVKKNPLLGIFWPMGQKDGNYLFWSTPEPMATFLGFKNYTSP